MTQSFFSQVFTFSHSFTGFTVFHQFVISLTIILQRQLHFFLAFNALSMARPRWRSLWRCWMTISEPSGPGRPGKPQTMQDCSLEALTVFSSDFLMFSWFSTRFVEATPQLLESVKADRQLGSWPKVDSCSAWQRQVNAYESQLKLEEVATITVGRPKEKGLWRRLVRGKPPESYSIKANSCCDGKLKPWIKDDERM